jgi:hypothetical protein
MVSNQFCLQTFLKFLLMSIAERDKYILQKVLIDLAMGLYDSLEMQAISISIDLLNTWDQKLWSISYVNTDNRVDPDEHRCLRDGPLSLQAVLNTGGSLSVPETIACRLTDDYHNTPQEVRRHAAPEGEGTFFQSLHWPVRS